LLQIVAVDLSDSLFMTTATEISFPNRASALQKAFEEKMSVLIGHRDAGLLFEQLIACEYIVDSDTACYFRVVSIVASSVFRSLIQDKISRTIPKQHSTAQASYRGVGMR
jgi:hypothetical protein